MAKSKAQKEAQRKERRADVKFAVDKLADLLKNPLIAAMAGYAAVDVISKLRNAQGEPYLHPTNASVLKGICVGFPLGGFAGLAAGSAVVVGSQVSSYSSQDWLRGFQAITGPVIRGLQYLP